MPTLPELPKQHKKKEADFGVRLRKWLRENPTFSCAYEVKYTPTNSLPFNALEDHQRTYLKAIKSPKGELIRVQGVNGEPDYIWLRNFPACVVIKYPHSFHLIDVDTFVMEDTRSKRRSLTSERAEAISIISVAL